MHIRSCYSGSRVLKHVFDCSGGHTCPPFAIPEPRRWGPTSCRRIRVQHLAKEAEGLVLCDGESEKFTIIKNFWEVPMTRFHILKMKSIVASYLLPLMCWNSQ